MNAISSIMTLALALVLALPLQAEEPIDLTLNPDSLPAGDAPQAQAGPELREGTAEGVVRELEFRQGAFVLVTEDGRERYVPRWLGGSPMDGGGLDQDMLEQVRHLREGARVRIEWMYDERRRVTSLEVLDEGPTQGVAHGIIAGINKEKGIIELLTADGIERFTPHWRGGMPRDGGGLDAGTIQAVAAFNKGDVVSIVWTWEERKRIEQIRVADKEARKRLREQLTREQIEQALAPAEQHEAERPEQRRRR